MNHVLTNLFRTSRRATVMTRTLTKEPCVDQTALEYCVNIVKQHDYENFLATLLMTTAIRTPAFVVRAFNVEVARIQDQTSDSQTALMRLQFWHDTLEKIFTNNQTLRNIPANPVAQELFKVCCCYGLQKRHLEKLLTSRSTLLKAKYFKSLEDVEKYAEDSVSTIYYLLLRIASVANINADHAASHLGKAQGITNILRSIHVSNLHKSVVLPMDILMKHQVSQEHILRGIDSEGVRNVTYDIATRANSHLQKAKKISVPKETRQIFLPAIAVHRYLKHLEQCNFDVFNKSLQKPSSMLPISLYYNRLINSF